MLLLGVIEPKMIFSLTQIMSLEIVYNRPNLQKKTQPAGTKAFSTRGKSYIS